MSRRPLRILGVETSCDETSAAVVEDGGRVVSSVVASQIPLHRLYRGVVPELASRAHMEKIPGVVAEAMRGLSWDSIDAVAYTRGPGLAGALLVGKVAAETLAYAHRKPLVAVNHLEGHAIAVEFHEKVAFPYLAFIVSGGHTDLVRMSGRGRLKVLARTRDDAAGEAFDKAAKLLGLGYPGGPAIDRAARGGDREAVAFPRADFAGSLDFSFSGLKTSLLYHLRKHHREVPATKSFRVPPRRLKDLCASYQEAIVDTLISRVVGAARAGRLARVVIGGGVAANSRFREKFLARCEREGLSAHFVPLRWCTDNAAMIAQAGLHRFRARRVARDFRRGLGSPARSKVDPSLPMRSWSA